MSSVAPIVGVTDRYVRNGVVVSVYDGDTMTVDIDLGFGVWKRKEKLRLYRINTPENNTPEGQAVTAYVKGLLLPGTEITIQTIKNRQEKYGRYLAEVWFDFDGTFTCLNDLLLSTGRAVAAPWD